MPRPLQLNPPLPVETPRGWGWAHLVHWQSIEHSLYWTVFLASGVVWTFPNEDVRAMQNHTGERPEPLRPHSVDQVIAAHRDYESKHGPEESR